MHTAAEEDQWIADVIDTWYYAEPGVKQITHRQRMALAVEFITALSVRDQYRDHNRETRRLEETVATGRAALKALEDDAIAAQDEYDDELSPSDFKRIANFTGAVMTLRSVVATQEAVLAKHVQEGPPPS